MDEAFVEDAKDQVDDEHRHDEEEAQSLERRLKRLCGALEAGGNAGGKICFDRVLDSGDRLAQRDPRGGIERYRDGGELAEVLNGEWAGGAFKLGDGAERN